jgi:hypothetical protein
MLILNPLKKWRNACEKRYYTQKKGGQRQKNIVFLLFLLCVEDSAYSFSG